MAEWRSALQAQAQAEALDASGAVWPEHWHAVQVFLGMASQWHVRTLATGAPLLVGLRYESIASVERAVRHNVPRPLRMNSRRKWPMLWDQLRCLEQHAARVSGQG